MDNESDAALITLMAFIGAVFGCTGCVAATFTADSALGAIAVGGTLVCGAIWRRYLLPVGESDNR